VVLTLDCGYDLLLDFQPLLGDAPAAQLLSLYLVLFEEQRVPLGHFLEQPAAG